MQYDGVCAKKTACSCASCQDEVNVHMYYLVLIQYHLNKNSTAYWSHIFCSTAKAFRSGGFLLLALFFRKSTSRDWVVHGGFALPKPCTGRHSTAAPNRQFFVRQKPTHHSGDRFLDERVERGRFLFSSCFYHFAFSGGAVRCGAVAACSLRPRPHPLVSTSAARAFLSQRWVSPKGPSAKSCRSLPEFRLPGGPWTRCSR